MLCIGCFILNGIVSSQSNGGWIVIQMKVLQIPQQGRRPPRPRCIKSPSSAEVATLVAQQPRSSSEQPRLSRQQITQQFLSLLLVLIGWSTAGGSLGLLVHLARPPPPTSGLFLLWCPLLIAAIQRGSWPLPHCATFWVPKIWRKFCLKEKPLAMSCKIHWTMRRTRGGSKWKESKCNYHGHWQRVVLLWFSEICFSKAHFSYK